MSQAKVEFPEDSFPAYLRARAEVAASRASAMALCADLYTDFTRLQATVKAVKTAKKRHRPVAKKSGR